MSVKNSYPELPEVPYFNAQLNKEDIKNILKNFMWKSEVKKTAYVVSINETGNFKSVVNGKNIAGFQADSGRWKPEGLFAFNATTIKNENMTGNARRFLVFDDVTSSLFMLCYKMAEREMYIGSPNILTIQDLARKYWVSWVTGNPDSKIPVSELNNFVNLYNSVSGFFD